MKSNERDALVKRINNKLKQSDRKLKSVKGVGVIVNTISGEITENGVNIEAYGTALGVMKSAPLPIAGVDLAEKVDTTAAEVEAAAVKTIFKVRKNAWDNWSGYESGRVVLRFMNTPAETQEQQAWRWLSEKTGQSVELLKLREELRLAQNALNYASRRGEWYRMYKLRQRVDWALEAAYKQWEKEPRG